MKNSDVAKAWAEGRKARVRHMSTDGNDLFSYWLKIGETLDDGRKIVYNYTASGEFHSPTTSSHVGYANRAIAFKWRKVTENHCYSIGHCDCRRYCRDGCAGYAIKSSCFPDFVFRLTMNKDLEFIPMVADTPSAQLGPGGVGLYYFLERTNASKMDLCVDPKYKDRFRC